MKTKLTLSVDNNLVAYAKQRARQQGGSVSSLFADFLANQKAREEHDAIPSSADMARSLKKYHVVIDDSKDAIRKLYAKKYLS